jgi:hypothetical protein
MQGLGFDGGAWVALLGVFMNCHSVYLMSEAKIKASCSIRALAVVSLNIKLDNFVISKAGFKVFVSVSGIDFSECAGKVSGNKRPYEYCRSLRPGRAV